MQKLLKPNGKSETAASDKAIMGIIHKFADKTPLKEPLPLNLVAPLLFRSWIIDGTITKDMLNAGREGTDVEDNAKKRQ